MRLVRLACVAAVALAVLSLVACGGDSDSTGTTNDANDLVVDTQEEGGPDWVKSIADPAPGEAVAGFVAAAIERDFRAMWDSLSVATQQRVAPAFEQFQQEVAQDFAASVGAFVAGEYEIVTSVRTSDTLAVASLAGPRVDPATKKREFETFGAALVKQDGVWKLELFAPVSLTLVVPEERIAQKIPRVAVAAEAGAPILAVGVWIDGKQYPSPTEGASPTQMTIFSEPDAEQFAPGDHTVMALASIGDTATATAWTFVIAD